MKLHLGCGKRFIPGYYHVDVVDYPHVDLRHEVDSLPMVPTDSVDVVYACHVLEHFHRRDTLRVLREWMRVLKPSGILRVSVPDFGAMVGAYHDHGLDALHGLLFGRQDYLYNIHHTVFDEQALSSLFWSAGAKDVRKYDWRQTEHATVDDYSSAYLPHMDREHGMLMSLNMEATK